MQTHEINQRFTEHFRKAGHTVVPSASLILDDPTLLFVNAGMVQFKPYFLGDAPAPYPRATSIQKCVRTGDIDEVGKTTRHNTFFQMAGNFSFGDYFKEGAMEHAWGLLTSSQADGGYGFDPERLWVTVFEKDEEAAALWQKVTGIPAERIQVRDAKDNYWDMGVPGPGGPCSEIYYDRGPKYGREGGPVVDEDRYIEIWNLVFMQDIRGELPPKEGHPPIGELPTKNIDTGMGVERVACLLQGVENVYETDLVRPVIAKAEELSGRSYGANHEDDVRFRVIADHARSGVMLVGDGVTPGNEARGYVLRRLLRRIIRSTRLLGVHEPVLGEFAAVVRDAMAPSYPELVTEFDRIDSVMRNEEDAFLSTLTAGSKIFDLAVADTKKAGGTQLAGAKAFQLHDTYGFPIDLTLEMASEQGLSVDEHGFRELMSEQRRRAKEDAKSRKSGHGDLSTYRTLLDQHGTTEFLGYTDLQAQSRVLGLLVDGVPAKSAAAGTEVELILDRTPFYAEGGGQIADTGRLTGPGVEVEVHDVQRAVPGLFVHRAKVTAGELGVDTSLEAAVDSKRRHAIERSHSATHLVHAAVRSAYGKRAAQAGSLNSPGRMRFDFTAPAAVSGAVLGGVEEEVNSYLQNDVEVQSYTTTMDRAMELGAVALFGEKYGDQVRVVDMGDYSRELCGGTHVGRIGQLGVVKLVADSSVGSGVHRVEALVGMDAMRHISKEHLLVSRLAEQFKVPAEELPERIAGVVSRLRSAEKELEQLRVAQVLQSAGELAGKGTDVHGVTLVAEQVPDGVDGGALRALAGEVRGRLGSRPAVVALFSADGDKVSFVVGVNTPAQDLGLKAGKLVPSFAAEVGGRGGGKPDMAQGGGSNPAGITAAIAALRTGLDQAVARG
ncbi:alanyl-tRNA synthetase [Saccharopolyspora erythraea NRRL 2338]|uniref:Alanine--tRNA ligase n=2 Tax=Saccharopolyspora erythraea TaxID=1836 RepID=SYA_SACEN|nr:alanine--tRNA ligase [Saccharopolyspora erythraea]A4FBD3.1 RecName: Full=Alanine--tRNA ligase; AltName: Full=Alanyl-tRNA synthetase; Short=AlaRS [Saccharopolyspora erythraea NRRL 2338]EQD86448.1 alanyl-tRNA synthetase [Saccharopolyspora erythraea D]PFG95140.1 alanyl-tRNA synthetase [Saccharopolyspora erythraea NRRL 2338]QRK91812.1 alanine--tRNA ligase [Saccharopolyspora erythraea]CAM01358.1 putative alanyl-tRNA synthetase [Saccharopolyspora erythraea NRRL 2338]